MRILTFFNVRTIAMCIRRDIVTMRFMISDVTKATGSSPFTPPLPLHHFTLFSPSVASSPSSFPPVTPPPPLKPHTGWPIQKPTIRLKHSPSRLGFQNMSDWRLLKAFSKRPELALGRG